MAYKVEEQDLNKFIMIGDRVLLKPKENQNKTKSGLYLPPNVQEKEKVHSGYVVKVGPGYPIPAVTDADEPWKEQQEEVKYVPLQPQEGDLAVYLQNNAWEVDFNGQKYVVLPQSAILFLIRDESLFT
jgi:co-chaperonin GroES (HSP10)